MSCDWSWNPVAVAGGCLAAGAKGAAGLGADAAGSVATGVMHVLASALGDAVGWMVKNLGTFWVHVPTAADSISTDRSSAVGFMWEHLHWYVAALLVFSILFGAGKIVITRRAQPLTELLKNLGVFALVTGAALPTIAALAEAADQFSSWIINEATGADFTAGIGKLMAIGTVAEGPGMQVLVIIGGLLAVLASIVQIMLLLMRSAMIVLLASVLPMTAAFTNTEMGGQWFKRAVAWLLAFILYKPVASIIYALAFRMVSGNGGGDAVMGLLTGLTMMILSLLALPALMRFMVPAVAHTAGGAGFGAVVGAAAAGSAAMVGMRMMGSGSQPGGKPGLGPTGAAPSPGGRGAGAGGGAAAGGAVAAQVAGQKIGQAAATPGRMAGQSAGESEE